MNVPTSPQERRATLSMKMPGEPSAVACALAAHTGSMSDLYGIAPVSPVKIAEKNGAESQ